MWYNILQQIDHENQIKNTFIAAFSSDDWCCEKL